VDRLAIERHDRKIRSVPAGASAYQGLLPLFRGQLPIFTA